MKIKLFCNCVGTVFVIVLEIKHAMSIVSALSRKDTPKRDIEKLAMKMDDFCKRNVAICQEWRMSEEKHKSFTGNQTKIKEYRRLKKKESKHLSTKFSLNGFKKILKKWQNTNNQFKKKYLTLNL